ncbi:MAG: universal stress protein [Haloferacaceae archaeon]
MHQTILAPVDGSDESFKAAEYAVELAVSDDATVHALFVMEAKPAYTRYGIGALEDEPSEEQREYAEDSVERVAELAAESGVDCVTEVTRGVPHETIAEHAREIDADVIVMGKHGEDWGGLEDLVMGSTTERVARRTDVPVTIVE